MRTRDVIELLALAALWGASFLFMRVAAPEFGPPALVFLRVLGAALLLTPVLLWQGHGPALIQHWRGIATVGVVNSVLPFMAFALAALALGAGLMAVFNAATPLATALVGFVWLRERLTRWRRIGLMLGFAGVAWLVWDRAGLPTGERAVSPILAIAACLCGALCYGFGANIARTRLAGVAPMAIAAGSQLAAALVMLVPAWWAWPAGAPSATAWLATAALALLSTGVAYVLYFRLIAHAGAVNASAVTFLIPLFALAFGALLLGEQINAAMLTAGAVILAGTALATGLVSPGGRVSPAAAAPVEDRR